jgi:hypothetical protein
MTRLIGIGVMVVVVSAVLTLIIYAIQVAAQPTHATPAPASVRPFAFLFKGVRLQDGQMVNVSGMIEVRVEQVSVVADTAGLKMVVNEVLETAVRHIAAYKTLDEFQQTPSILSLKIREASQDALAQKGLAIVSLVIKDVVV